MEVSCSVLDHVGWTTVEFGGKWGESTPLTQQWGMSCVVFASRIVRLTICGGTVIFQRRIASFLHTTVCATVRGLSTESEFCNHKKSVTCMVTVGLFKVYSPVSTKVMGRSSWGSCLLWFLWRLQICTDVNSPWAFRHGFLGTLGMVLVRYCLQQPHLFTFAHCPMCAHLTHSGLQFFVSLFNVTLWVYSKVDFTGHTW
jgi:hypothetical protein